MRKVVSVPPYVGNKIVFRRGAGPEVEIPEDTPLEIVEQIGCLVQRDGAAYTWHDCPDHALLVIWEAYDVEEVSVLPKGDKDD